MRKVLVPNIASWVKTSWNGTGMGNEAMEINHARVVLARYKELGKKDEPQGKYNRTVPMACPPSRALQKLSINLA
jgi:hypothetical protein